MSSGKVGLHNHADTSTLDGLAFPEEMAERAVEIGDEAISINDHDDVGGQYIFQKACMAAGVKPILGIEARWLRNIAASREAKTRGLDASHICLQAADNTGLSNMWALSSLAYEPENFYGKPQLSPELMREYSAGLWASDGCGLTRFCRFVNEGKLDEARQEWGILRDIFGERFYSELHTFQILEPQNDDDRKLNAEIMRMNQVKVQFSKEMGVPLVVVNDAHYAQRAQWREHRLVWQMNTKWKGDQTESKGQAADWIMDRDEILHFMGAQGIATSVIEEAMKNSLWIAEDCNAEIKPGLAMPRLHPTDAEDIDAFEGACLQGYRRMVLDKGLPEETYGPRLEREMRLIIDKGMAGYFNVVADYVGRARDGSYIQWVVPGAKKKPCLWWLTGQLAAGHHQSGPDPVRPDVRAVHQPRPSRLPRHRRRLPEGPPPRR
jgi:DNA polymerase-3 subunit alpha